MDGAARLEYGRPLSPHSARQTNVDQPRALPETAGRGSQPGPEA